MIGWWELLALTALFVVSIYLIAKGVEIALRGTKSSNPNRSLDLLVGILLLIPGIAAGAVGFFWILPNLRQ